MVSLEFGLAVLVVLVVVSTVFRRRVLQQLEMQVLRRVAVVSGSVAPAVAIGGIVVAVLLAPGFDPLSGTLSDLGVAGGPAAWVFNTAMVATGLVALPFGVAILFDGTALEKVSFLFLAAAMNGLNMVGVFQKGQALHVWGGLLFYVSFTVAFLCYGVGARERAQREARVTLGLAGGHVSLWLVWGVVMVVRQPAGNPAYAPGIAIPEFLGALVLAGWTGWVAHGRFGGVRS
jgi:hypothetical membrane protein